MSGILWAVYFSGVVRNLTVACLSIVAIYAAAVLVAILVDTDKFDKDFKTVKSVLKKWYIVAIALIVGIFTPNSTYFLSYAGLSMAEKVVENKTASQLVDKTVLLINKKLDDALAGDNDKGSK